MAVESTSADMTKPSQLSHRQAEALSRSLIYPPRAGDKQNAGPYQTDIVQISTKARRSLQLANSVTQEQDRALSNATPQSPPTPNRKAMSVLEGPRPTGPITGHDQQTQGSQPKPTPERQPKTIEQTNDPTRWESPSRPHQDTHVRKDDRPTSPTTARWSDHIKRGG